MSDMQIKALLPEDYRRWDDFVMQHEQATFFHLSGWREVMIKAFNHPTHYLFAERDGEIQGVLPLAQLKSRLFGNALVSTPFCVYGGAIASDTDTANRLVEAACRLAEDLGVDHLELRNRQRQHSDWLCKELYFTFRKNISDDSEENLKAIPRKQRAVVRKAMKNELDTQIDPNIDDFYRGFAIGTKAHGTPVFSKRYFETLAEVFPEQTEVMSIRKEGQLLTTVLSFYFKDEILPYYAGGTDDARHYKANDYKYWQLMNHAAEKGVKLFDYGRSKAGTGPYSFKKNWGFTPEPLYYEYFLVKAKEMPDVNPLNPKYQTMIKVWQRLPLWLTTIIGPPLSKYLG